MSFVTRRFAVGGALAVSSIALGVSGVTASPVDQKITGVVPPLRQPKTMACWATAATMMHSWKKNQSISIEAALSEIDPNYLEIFEINKGLISNNKPGFLLSAGLRSEAPQNYTTQGWANLIRRHGPLWVTTAEGQNFSIHARVMTAIFGDGTGNGTTVVIIDPADGAVHTEKLSIFDQKFEAVARQDLGNCGELRPQVVHY